MVPKSLGKKGKPRIKAGSLSAFEQRSNPMSDSWFFPDSYLAEMEALVAAMYEVEGKTKKPDIKDVLLMAQAFGVYMRGQTEKAGSIQHFLKGIRKKGGSIVARTELPNKRYYEFLRFVAHQAKLVEDAEFSTIEPTTETVTAEPEKPEVSTAKVWEQLQEVYKEHAPSEWPQLTRKLPLGKMTSRLEEGISYAGSAEDFIALYASALKKTPDFYRNSYVRKGAKLRPVTDCILCLLSADKNHKDLGVSGWRVFEWSDLMDAGEAPAPGTRHPSEEFVSWTGTRWSHRDPFMADEEIDMHKANLIAAGLAPTGSQ